jgi:hypothetical protein
MSNNYSHKLNLFEEALHADIKRLVDEDGYSWEMLADFAGYDGVNSLRNIVIQASHSLSFARGARLLRELSKRDNFRMHRHVVDPALHVINPRVSACGEPLKDAHDRLIREIHTAEMAIEEGNVNRVYLYYRFLLEVASRVQLEMGRMQLKSTAGDSSAHRLIEPHDDKCADGQYTPLAHVRKAEAAYA